MHGNRTFVANKISNTSGAIINVNDESWDNGEVFFPFRMIVGASYQYNKKWIFAGDYTFQKMSAYEEFGTNQEFQDYHKAAIGGSLQPVWALLVAKE